MRRKQIPTCFFPSTVLFVDDSRDFLLNFTLQLDEDIAFKINNSPYEALETLHKNYQAETANERALSEHLNSDACPITNYAVNLNLSAIHTEVYNPQRFSEISVVVVDYAMPGMNGLDFCRKMENSQVKRILLTGRADERIAVQAFNDGIIDLYIQKQNPNISETINNSIKRMQLSYFQNMSEMVVKMLSVSSPNCLQDPAFIRVFNEIVEKNSITEYYLIENSGSFLMLNADAEISYLIIKSQQDLDLHLEMARDNQAPETVLKQLEKGEKMPFFWRPDDYFEPEWDDWSTYLYPAKKVEGTETYYFSYVSRPLSTDIKKDKVLSFNQYMDEMEI